MERVVAKRDVHLPVRERFRSVARRGRFVWFADHTSPTPTDDSMTGFTYMDSRSGAMVYYTSAGGEFNSVAARERSVSANPIMTKGRMIPTHRSSTMGIGQNTWVVRPLASDGKFQTLALVQAAGGHVVVGNSSLAAALRWRTPSRSIAAFLGVGNPGAEGVVSSVGAAALFGQIDRMGTGTNGMMYFTLRGSARIFSVDGNADPAVLLARPGDRVFFRSGSSENGESPKVADFRDTSLRK